MIVIADYGMGNLRNVRRAVEACGAAAVVSSSPEDLRVAEKILLPGVGAFGEAVRRIDALGLRYPLLESVQKGTPTLGICLGMQLLFEKSEESPGARGLGVIPGEIVRFGGGVKVPHIGWNDVVPIHSSDLFPGAGGVFYFVHSFYLPVSAFAVAKTIYGGEWVSAVQRGRVFGAQFHPEKSQESGLRTLRAFLSSEGGN